MIRHCIATVDAIVKSDGLTYPFFNRVHMWDRETGEEACVHIDTEIVLKIVPEEK